MTKESEKKRKKEIFNLRLLLMLIRYGRGMGWDGTNQRIGNDFYIISVKAINSG